MNYSELTDEELLQMAGGGKKPKIDYSSLSDEELLNRANGTQSISKPHDSTNNTNSNDEFDVDFSDDADDAKNRRFSQLHPLLNSAKNFATNTILPTAKGIVSNVGDALHDGIAQTGQSLQEIRPMQVQQPIQNVQPQVQPQNNSLYDNNAVYTGNATYTNTMGHPQAIPQQDLYNAMDEIIRHPYNLKLTNRDEWENYVNQSNNNYLKNGDTRLSSDNEINNQFNNFMNGYYDEVPVYADNQVPRFDLQVSENVLNDDAKKYLDQKEIDYVQQNAKGQQKIDYSKNKIKELVSNKINRNVVPNDEETELANSYLENGLQRIGQVPEIPQFVSNDVTTNDYGQKYADKLFEIGKNVLNNMQPVVDIAGNVKNVVSNVTPLTLKVALKSTVSSVLNATEGLGDFISQTGFRTGNGFGGKTERSVGGFIEKVSSKLLNHIFIDDKYNDISGLTHKDTWLPTLVNNVCSQVTNLAVSLGGAVTGFTIGGVAGAITAFGITSIPNILQEGNFTEKYNSFVEQYGRTPTKAELRVILNATMDEKSVNTILETCADKVLAGRFFKNSNKKTLKDAIKNIAKDTCEQMATETITETLQEGSSVVADTRSGVNNASAKDNVKRILKAGAMGGVTGAVLGGAGSGFSNLKSNNKYNGSDKAPKVERSGIGLSTNAEIVGNDNDYTIIRYYDNNSDRSGVGLSQKVKPTNTRYLNKEETEKFIDNQLEDGYMPFKKKDGTYVLVGNGEQIELSNYQLGDEKESGIKSANEYGLLAPTERANNPKTQLKVPYKTLAEKRASELAPQTVAKQNGSVEESTNNVNLDGYAKVADFNSFQDVINYGMNEMKKSDKGKRKIVHNADGTYSLYMPSENTNVNNISEDVNNTVENETQEPITGEVSETSNVDNDNTQATKQGEKPKLTKFSAKDLLTDPKTFQYKDNTDENGVKETLKTVKSWDDLSSGKVIVYETKDGKRYIADGHQRLGLANRLMSEGKENDIQLDGYLYREVDGWSPDEIMMKASYKNIRENSGSIIETAKIIRLSGGEEKVPDNVPRNNNFNVAVGLSKLTQENFNRVVNEEIKPEYASIVGKIIEDGRKQKLAIDSIVSGNPSSLYEAELITRQILHSDTTSHTQTNLFGTQEIVESLAPLKAKIVSATVRKLKNAKSQANSANSGKEILEEFNNKISVEDNKKLAEKSKESIDLLERHLWSDNILSRKVNEIVQKVNNEEITEKEAVTELSKFVNSIKYDTNLMKTLDNIDNNENLLENDKTKENDNELRINNGENTTISTRGMGESSGQSETIRGKLVSNGQGVQGRDTSSKEVERGTSEQGTVEENYFTIVEKYFDEVRDDILDEDKLVSYDDAYKYSDARFSSLRYLVEDAREMYDRHKQVLENFKKDYETKLDKTKNYKSKSRAKNQQVKLKENYEQLQKSANTVLKNTQKLLLDRLEEYYKAYQEQKDLFDENGNIKDDDSGKFYQKGNVSQDKTETENFKNWSDNAPLVTSDKALKYNFKTGKKVVVQAFHGSKRVDRIGSVFRPDRATSGPMAFFSSNREISEGYAQNKSDTSLNYEDTSYENYYKYNLNGEEIRLPDVWHKLPKEIRDKISKNAPHITFDDEAVNIIFDKNQNNGSGNYNQYLKESNGNALQALVHEWLNSGNLYNEEEKFAEVLKLVGLKENDFVYDNPNADHSGVYDVYISMKNPLVTNDIPQNVLNKIEQEAKNQPLPGNNAIGADFWDKNFRNPIEWVKKLKEDYKNNEVSHVWTSIPDWVSNILKDYGYDGIIDIGGKSGGEIHKVYIPFESSQIKSVDNNGNFNGNNPNIYEQKGNAGKPKRPSTLTKYVNEVVRPLAEVFCKKTGIPLEEFIANETPQTVFRDDENSGSDVLNQSAMYKSPLESFNKFYNQVFEKEKLHKQYGKILNKSYYEYNKNNVYLRVKHDAINHDVKRHKLSSKEWKNILRNILNIENAGISKKQYSNDDVALIKINTPMGKYGVAIQFANGSNYISTAFKSSDTGIDSWIEKGSANSSTSEPLTSRNKIHTVAVVSQNPNNIIDYVKQNLNPNVTKYNQSTYKGSASNHDIESTDYIGTGEGNIAHGWGLYYAENKDIAESYRKLLTSRMNITYNGVKLKDTEISKIVPLTDVFDALIEQNKNVALKLLDERKTRSEETLNSDATHFLKTHAKSFLEKYDEYKRILENIDESKFDGINNGQLYEVDIPENDVLLDENKHFTQQSLFVKKALRKLFKDKGYNLTELMRTGYVKGNPVGGQLYGEVQSISKGSAKNASLLLNQYGIKGITYDGRQDGRCYVVFDDKAVNIIKKYYQEQEEIKGSYNPATNVIEFFKNADASTSVHEVAHWMLNTWSKYENSSPEIKRDLDAIRKFVGNKGEEFTREQHEKVARAMEAYFRFGKTKVNSLRRVFDKFKRLLRAIYKNIKEIVYKFRGKDTYFTEEDLENITDLFDRLFTTEADRKMMGLVDKPIENIKTKNGGKKVGKLFQKSSDDNFDIDNVDEILKKVKKEPDEVFKNIFTPLSSRLDEISPSLKHAIRKFELGSSLAENKSAEIIKPFIQKVSKMDKMFYAKYDLALKNGNKDVIDKINKRYGIEKEYNAIKKLLSDIRKEAISAGLDVGEIEDYFPRKVINPSLLLDEYSKSSFIRNFLKEIDPQNQLSAEEKITKINTSLKGHNGAINATSSFVKGRKISEIDKNLNRYYKDSMDALVDYITSMNNAIQTRKFFGNSEKDLDNSIGAFTKNLIENGIIKPSDEVKLKKLLLARFNQRSMHGGIKTLKNLGYITTMGNPLSAVTQLGDFAFSLYKNGVFHTIVGLKNSVFKTNRITKKDLGIDRIAQEFDNDCKSGKIVDNVFFLVGLNKIDALGKETFINGAMSRNKKFAINALENKNSKNAKEYYNYLHKIFGDETYTVLEDLRNEKLSDNVKYLLFSEISDFQPISLSEMPEAYLKSGNGRIFYMLKTYSIKLLDVFRNETYRQFKAGNYKKSMMNLIKLGFYITLLGVTSDKLKDWMLGRESNMGDTITDNILKMAMFSKYQLDKSKTEGIGKTIYSNILPPSGFIDDVWKDVNSVVKDDYNVKDFKTLRDIPVVGKMYYWWFGGGVEIKEKEFMSNRKKEYQKYLETGDKEIYKKVGREIYHRGYTKEETKKKLEKFETSYKTTNTKKYKPKLMEKMNKHDKKGVQNVVNSMRKNKLPSEEVRRIYDKAYQDYLKSLQGKG